MVKLETAIREVFEETLKEIEPFNSQNWSSDYAERHLGVLLLKD